MPDSHFGTEVLTHTPDITRPPKELIARLQAMGTANAVGSLFRLGIRNAHIIGPDLLDARARRSPARR